MSRKNRGGRRNKYYSHVEPRLDEVLAWLRKGLSEEEVYTNLGVSKTSWYNYKQQHVELVDTIQKGKKCQIAITENTLFNMAQGYYYEEEQVHKVRDADGFEVLEKVNVRRYKHPNLGAVVFLLKNKAPDEYADNITMNRIKREELELKKMIAEMKMF